MVALLTIVDVKREGQHQHEKLNKRRQKLGLRRQAPLALARGTRRPLLISSIPNQVIHVMTQSATAAASRISRHSCGLCQKLFGFRIGHV
jgi:hypothetical protein